MIREPVVSGQFYPAGKKELSEIINSLAPPETSKISAKGIILPHAGYIYSGRVTATTVSKVLARKRLIILGNNHTGFGPDFGLWDKGSWLTPLGKIDIDEELAKLILSKGELITEDFLAHKAEHSIEVQLPILSQLFGDFKFVPIACGISKLEKYTQAASQIYEAIKAIKNEILLVASTDLTHYEPEATARRKDREVIEAIVNLDEQSLIRKVNSQNITMCGVAPVAVLISCLKKLGAKKSQVALYQTSADTTGDFSSVVGYVGMIIN